MSELLDVDAVWDRTDCCMPAGLIIDVSIAYYLRGICTRARRRLCEFPLDGKAPSWSFFAPREGRMESAAGLELRANFKGAKT